MPPKTPATLPRRVAATAIAATAIALGALPGCAFLLTRSVWVDRPEASAPETVEASDTATRSLAAIVREERLTPAAFADGLSQVLGTFHSGLPMAIGEDTGTAIVPIVCWSPAEGTRRLVTGQEALARGWLELLAERRAGEFFVREATNWGERPVLLLSGSVVGDGPEPRHVVHDTFIPPGTVGLEVLLARRPPKGPRRLEETHRIESDLKPLLERFLGSRRTVGLAVVEDGRVRTIEIFGEGALFRRLAGDILRRHVADAHANRGIATDAGSIFPGGRPSRAILESARSVTRFERFPGGTRFTGEGFRGSVCFAPDGELLRYRCEFD